MKPKKLIFDNRSSKPLYESISLAYNLYFECWSEKQPNFAAASDDFMFIWVDNFKIGREADRLG